VFRQSAAHKHFTTKNRFYGGPELSSSVWLQNVSHRTVAQSRMYDICILGRTEEEDLRGGSNHSYAICGFNSVQLG
jgi:hypothetical protein